MVDTHIHNNYVVCTYVNHVDCSKRIIFLHNYIYGMYFF